jgi:hypothetical protein
MYPILSFDQMRRWEELSWKQGIRQEAVIYQAGVAVGKSVLEWIQRGGIEEYWSWLGRGITETMLELQQSIFLTLSQFRCWILKNLKKDSGN